RLALARFIIARGDLATASRRHSRRQWNRRMSSLTHEQDHPARRSWVVLARVLTLLFIAIMMCTRIAALPLDLADYEHPCVGTRTESCAMTPADHSDDASISVAAGAASRILSRYHALSFQISGLTCSPCLVQG